MGADAAATVWYGVRVDGRHDGAEDAFSDFYWGELGDLDWVVDGVTIEVLVPSDGEEPVGFGVLLASSDWQTAPEPWDEFVGRASREQTDAERAAVEKAASGFGFPVSAIGRWIHTSYL